MAETSYTYIENKHLVTYTYTYIETTPLIACTTYIDDINFSASLGVHLKSSSASIGTVVIKNESPIVIKPSGTINTKTDANINSLPNVISYSTLLNSMEQQKDIIDSFYIVHPKYTKNTEDVYTSNIYGQVDVNNTIDSTYITNIDDNYFYVSYKGQANTDFKVVKLNTQELQTVAFKFEENCYFKFKNSDTTYSPVSSYSTIYDGIDDNDVEYYTYNEIISYVNVNQSWQSIYNDNTNLNNYKDYFFAYYENISSNSYVYKQNPNGTYHKYFDQLENTYQYNSYNTDLYTYYINKLVKHTYSKNNNDLTYIYQQIFNYVKIDIDNPDSNNVDDIYKNNEYIAINNPDNSRTFVLLSTNGVYNDNLIYCDDTYSKIRIAEYPQNDKFDIYIKYNYKFFTHDGDQNSEENVKKLVNKYGYIYKLSGDNYFSYINIGNNFFGDIDLSGNTIYCNKDKKVISFKDIENIYNERIRTKNYNSKLEEYNRDYSNNCESAGVLYTLQYKPVMDYSFNYKTHQYSQDDIFFVEEENYIKINENTFPTYYKYDLYEYDKHIVDSDIQKPKYIILPNNQGNYSATSYNYDISTQRITFTYSDINGISKYYRIPEYTDNDSISDNIKYIKETCENSYLKRVGDYMPIAGENGIKKEEIESILSNGYIGKIVKQKTNYVLELETRPEPWKYAYYIKSKYLYENLTDSNGVQTTPNGLTYYTNIYCFNPSEKYSGQNKKLIKCTKVSNTYTYTLNVTSYVEVPYSVVDGFYDKTQFYIGVNGKYEQLTQDTELSSRNKYYKLVNGDVTHQYTTGINNGDEYNYYVKTINNELYGVINIEEPSKYTYSGDIINIIQCYKTTKITSSINNLDLIPETIDVKNVSKPIPLVIGNEYTYADTYTYTWHQPEYGYIIYDNNGIYESKYIQKNAGYWNRNYNKEVLPLHIASYNFYPDSETVNVTKTYSFIPNSYVVKSVVEYPRIAYNTITTGDEQIIYYTYNIDNITRLYNSSDPVEYTDNTYYGLVFGQKVKLAQHSTVVKTNKIIENVAQQRNVENNFISYKTSIALTNETVPVLYNTELIPAQTRDYVIWDAQNNTYVNTTFTYSEAYYSYKYMYNTIPLIVSSYNFQASYNTIDNFDILGTYIENSSYKIANNLLDLNNKITTQTNNYLNQSNIQNINFKNSYNLIKQCIDDNTNKILTHIDNNAKTLNQNISSLNNILSSKLGDLSSNTVKTVSELKTTLSSNINNQTTNLSNQLTNISNNVYSGIGNLNDTLHKDIIGDGLVFASYSVMEIDKRNGKLVGQPAIADYTKINTLAGIIEKAFIKSSVNVYSYTDSDTGNENIVTNYSYTGLVDVLYRLATKDTEPTKDAFLLDVIIKLFTGVDYETEIVSDVEYDENGNITKKITKKNNPTEIAQRSIMRAMVLYNVCKKSGLIPD